MNKFFLSILLSLSTSISAQSPYYSIMFSIEQNLKEDITYSYFHKLCTNEELTFSSDWFSHDTSTVDWENLSQDEIAGFYCSELKTEVDKYFKYSNQLLAYNRIAHIEISRSIKCEVETMIIVFPVMIQSFFTEIDLRGLKFRKGIYEISDGLNYDLEDNLKITLNNEFRWKKVESSELIF